MNPIKKIADYLTPSSMPAPFGLNPVGGFGLNFTTRNQQLPNDAGTYQSPVPVPGAGSNVPPNPGGPLPNFMGGYELNNYYHKSPNLFSKKNTGSTSTVPPQFINPKTGTFYTGNEYADNLGGIAPASPMRPGPYDVPRYAGNALTNPNQTMEQLNSQAYGLNNARNDIATGTTDPYKVASQSGIQYSPNQLSAIEKAYAGVYDPALSDVFSKIDKRQKTDAATLEAKTWREKQIFATNENIRQWRSTTGSKGGGGGAKTFTQTQLNKGASNSGLGMDGFDKLDSDLKNFFINPPKGVDSNTNKSVPLYSIFKSALDDVASGKSTPDEIAQEIADSNLPEAVKHYYIDQMPLAPEAKQSWFSKIWGAITGMFSG